MLARSYRISLIMYRLQLGLRRGLRIGGGIRFLVLPASQRASDSELGRLLLLWLCSIGTGRTCQEEEDRDEERKRPTVNIPPVPYLGTC